MATKRDLSLTQRKENQREAQPIEPPVQFSLSEIKQHFIVSMESIKAQYEVAASLSEQGNIEGSKTIWNLRSFFFAEGRKLCLFRSAEILGV